MDFGSVEFLSRLQFALTIMFHYIFPPLAIGMGVLLVWFEGMFLKTGNPVYERATRFWVKIFGLNFAIGVASGIVMEFQFGTNWANYSRFVGDVFGSALAAEGIFAFFLESGFLAVLVFGWNRVSPRWHFFSTIMVSLGSIFSSIWIVVANSWQQTPAGFHLVTNPETGFVRAEITDFWALVFNPSTVPRLVHVWLGAMIMGGFFTMSIAAFYLLKKRHQEFARKSFAAGLVLAFFGSILALVQGHAQAVNVAEHQPAKLAAFEGHFETGEDGAPLYLLGWPDEEEERVKAGVAVPGMLSFLVHGDTSRPVTGLDAFKPEDRPPVWLSFMSFHLMVGLGTIFIVLTVMGMWFLIRGTLYEKRWLLWIFVFAVLGPLAANQLGWIAAEVGRQPWIVYGLLRTSDGLSPVLDSGQVLGSIIMFGLIYLLLTAVWLMVLDAKIRKGPEEAEPGAPGGLMNAAAAMTGKSESLTSAKNGEGGGTSG